MILLKLTGHLYSSGEIILDPLKSIRWKELSDSKPPHLPENFKIGLSLTIDENDFLLGKDGIVWASYDLRQVEIIRSSLLAQQVNSEVIRAEFSSQTLFLIRIPLNKEINIASEFIWKSESGLRLKPDWDYPLGEINQSFEIWLNDN